MIWKLPVYPDRISQKATAASRQPGKERADTGTTSVSSEAGEKVEGLCRCLFFQNGAPFCPLDPPKRTSPASLLSLWWSVLAAQQPKSFQNGLRQLGLLGCAPCSPSGGPFWPLSSPNPSKRTSPASLLSLWLVRQNGPPLLFKPHRSLGSLSLPHGAPFCPLSGPNPPKRTTRERKCTETHRQLSCDEVTVPVCAQEHGRYHPTPPHPTPTQWKSWGGPFWRIWAAERPKRTTTEKGQGAQPSWPSWRGPFWRIWAAERPKRTTREERHRDPPPALVWWGYRACVRTGTWTLSSHPTPPHPPPHHTHPKTRYGVADEGKMVSQMRENQGGFGVTDEGFWCHRWGAYSFL